MIKNEKLIKNKDYIMAREIVRSVLHHHNAIDLIATLMCEEAEGKTSALEVLLEETITVCENGLKAIRKKEMKKDE